MWMPGTKPDVDDDLMTEWLMSTLRASNRGLTGETLRATIAEFVDHLSNGNARVERPASPDGN